MDLVPRNDTEGTIRRNTERIIAIYGSIEFLALDYILNDHRLILLLGAFLCSREIGTFSVFMTQSNAGRFEAPYRWRDGDHEYEERPRALASRWRMHELGSRGVARVRCSR